LRLVETGTRALIGAVIGSAADRDEAGLARRLLPLLGLGMLLLADRAFDSAAFRILGGPLGVPLADARPAVEQPRRAPSHLSS
jgi:hypothetical protein